MKQYYNQNQYNIHLKIQYRNVGIFHEYVTNQILDDFKKACDPKKITVIGDFHPRGGIKTTVKVHWPEL